MLKNQTRRVVAGMVTGLLSFAATAAPRSELIEVAPRIQLHLLEDGKASGHATLVLIPGWTLTASIWSHQIETFGRDRRVIAIDPRSQGDSTKTGEGDTPEQRARDYHVLLNSVHAGMGATNLPNILPFAVQQLRLLPLLSDSPRDYAEGMMRAIITKPLSDVDLNHLVSEALKTPPATAEAMLIADLFGKDRTAAMAKFTVPTLIIASERSAELAQQVDLAKQLPNARIVVVAQAGHAVFVDQPDRFESVVRDFLDQLPG